MSSDGVTTSGESVPDCWTALDDQFFMLVGDVLSTSFLWGAASLLASYDPDDTAAVTKLSRQSQPTPNLPSQRSIAA
jgi:hypothetical protein